MRGGGTRQHVFARDYEVEGEGLGVGTLGDETAHRDGLAGVKRLAWEEAGAVSLRVGLQVPRVAASARSAYFYVAEVADRRAQQADLCPWQGVIGVWQRGHGERRAGQHGRGLERAGVAAATCWGAEG